MNTYLELLDKIVFAARLTGSAHILIEFSNEQDIIYVNTLDSDDFWEEQFNHSFSQEEYDEIEVVGAEDYTYELIDRLAMLGLKADFENLDTIYEKLESSFEDD